MSSTSREWSSMRTWTANRRLMTSTTPLPARCNKIKKELALLRWLTECPLKLISALKKPRTRSWTVGHVTRWWRKSRTKHSTLKWRTRSRLSLWLRRPSRRSSMSSTSLTLPTWSSSKSTVLRPKRMLPNSGKTRWLRRTSWPKKSVRQRWLISNFPLTSERLMDR